MAVAITCHASAPRAAGGTALLSPPPHAVVRPRGASSSGRPLRVTFKWERVPDAVAYLVSVHAAGDIRADGTFDGPGRTQRTRSASWKMDLPPGAYAWEVSAVGEGDTPLGDSELRTLVACPRPVGPRPPPARLRVDRSEVVPPATVHVMGDVQGAPCTYVTLRLDDGPPTFARMGPNGTWFCSLALARKGDHRIVVTASDGLGVQQTSVSVTAPEIPAYAVPQPDW